MSVPKPTSFPNWTDGSPSKVQEPPPAKKLAGWTPGEPPPMQYMNWLFYNLDQWVKWIEQTLNVPASNVNLIAGMRLINGGNWFWDLASKTLTWDAAFDIMIPSIVDADNEVANDSAVLNDGDVLYTQVNLPFSVNVDTNNGSNQLTNIAFMQGIEVGQVIDAPGVPPGTTVTLLGVNSLTMSANASASATVVATFAQTGPLTAQVSPVDDLIPGPTTVVIARRVGDNIYLGVNAFTNILRDQESKKLETTGYDVVFNAIAGEGLLANTPVYISNGSDGGRIAGRVYKTDAGTANGQIRSQFVGFVATTVSLGQLATIVATGIKGGFTVIRGSTYYLDPGVVGGITPLRPSGAGEFVTSVGVALTSSDIDVVPGASTPVSGNTLLFQDDLGTADGIITAFGPLTFKPVDNDSISVYVDGLLQEKASWFFDGTNINFLVAPAAAQTILVEYLYNASLGREKIDYFTLSPTDITNKQIILSAFPGTPTLVVLDQIEGSPQQYAVDFTVSGNILSWSGLGLDGSLVSGDRLRVHYWTAGLVGQTERVEYRTITGGEDTANQLTLANTPLNGLLVLVDEISGSGQVYGTDFIVTGNILDWNGLDPDGVFITGAIFRIHYWS